MGNKYTLQELYEELLGIVIRQKKALKNDNVKKLEELTKKKDAYLQMLAEMEETVDINNRKKFDEQLKSVREKVVKEDKEFIELLREKEKIIIKNMAELKAAKGNLKNISSAYGKKFTMPHSSLDKKC